MSCSAIVATILCGNFVGAFAADTTCSSVGGCPQVSDDTSALLQSSRLTKSSVDEAMPLKTCDESSAAGRWSESQQNAWQKQYAWNVGANFIPSTAANSLEMWQEASFDEATIDRELAFAEGLGMSVMRVFLHDMAFSTDKVGFLHRMDRFLALAASHNISTMFVLFDGCWNPDGNVGPQPAPLPHIHNSQWIQAPLRKVLENKSQWHGLRMYIQGVISRFRDDVRVHSWDLYNEIDNPGPEVKMALRLSITQSTHKDISLRQRLLCKAFVWAREAIPVQPLHAGEWQGMSDDLRVFLRSVSDIGSFHSYSGPKETEELIQEMKREYPSRPLVLTEYMARPHGSTFETILPVARAHNVGAISWGLVRGKTNTVWPPSSWEETDQSDVEPKPWFHDILWPSGAAYNPIEVNIIKHFTGK